VIASWVAWTVHYTARDVAKPEDAPVWLRGVPDVVLSFLDEAGVPDGPLFLLSPRFHQPATSRRPWQPTRRGAAVLTALARSGIQALAAAHTPDVSGPARSRSRYRDRMPISLGPDAANARQAASLFRVLANPTRLVILLTLQTGEQRITDLAAQLGGSQANISAHLTRLRQAGLITSRQTQGRAVYYRLTSPSWTLCCRPPRSSTPQPGSRPPKKMTHR
jgi:DNA-binding transcriptional ArsR family regulator